MPTRRGSAASPVVPSVANASPRSAPSSRARSRCSACRCPVTARLPRQLVPNSLGSSPTKSTTRKSRVRRTPDARSVCAASIAPSTPTMPSNRPAPSTVSVCEPVTSTGAFGAAPGRTPIRLPAPSVSTCRPASRIRSATTARLARNGSENTGRVHPSSSVRMRRERVEAVLHAIELRRREGVVHARLMLMPLAR